MLMNLNTSTGKEANRFQTLMSYCQLALALIAAKSLTIFPPLTVASNGNSILIFIYFLAGKYLIRI